MIAIATILRETGETGVQTHFNSFRHFLEKRGNKVSVVTPFSVRAIWVYPIFAIRRIIDPVNSTISVWWYRYWHYFFLKMALRKALRTSGNGVVYVQCPLSAKAALEVRHSPGQKIVLVVHFNISQADEWVEKGKISRDGRYYRAIKQLEAEVIPRVDGLVYVSNFARHTLEEKIPAVRNISAKVVPNFMRKPEITNNITFIGDIITIGTLEDRKNQSFLLNVLAQARSKGETYTLSIVGDGPDRLKLESLAKELGIAEQVRFLGFRHHAATLIPQHKIYCHAAKMENLPLSLIESLAYGRPLIAAPVGGIPEVMSDGVEGMFWSLNDSSTAAEILISVMTDKKRYMEMSSAAVKRFDETFEESSVGKTLCDFLFSV